MLTNLISKNIRDRKGGLVCVLIIGFLLTGAGSAKATLVYSNYTDNRHTYSTLYGPEITEPFIAYSNSSGFWNLTQIKLDAHYFPLTNPAQAIISIYEDNDGSPGSLISKWNITLTNSEGDYLFTVSDVSLSADTNYWFGVKPTNSTCVAWSETNDKTGHVFEIQGEEVVNPAPEPTSMILLGSLAAGLFGVAGIRKRR